MVETGNTTDSKIYQAVGFQKNQSIKPKEFRSKSTIRPSNDPIGHHYLKNQFSDIKSKTYQRREFVKSLASEQTHFLKLDDMNKIADHNIGVSKSKKALRNTIKPIRDEILRGM